MSLFGCVNPHVTHKFLLELIEESVASGILLERARYKDGKVTKSMTDEEIKAEVLDIYQAIRFS